MNKFILRREIVQFFLFILVVVLTIMIIHEKRIISRNNLYFRQKIIPIGERRINFYLRSEVVLCSFIIRKNENMLSKEQDSETVPYCNQM